MSSAAFFFHYILVPFPHTLFAFFIYSYALYFTLLYILVRLIFPVFCAPVHTVLTIVNYINYKIVTLSSLSSLSYLVLVYSYSYILCTIYVNISFTRHSRYSLHSSPCIFTRTQLYSSIHTVYTERYDTLYT